MISHRIMMKGFQWRVCEREGGIWCIRNGLSLCWMGDLSVIRVACGSDHVFMMSHLGLIK